MEAPNQNSKQNQSPSSTLSIERILGIVLLIPPLLSVVFFLISVFSEYDSDKNEVAQLGNLSPNWSGYFNWGGNGGGGGFTSAAPIYLGLMAIAGAILISRSSKK